MIDRMKRRCATCARDRDLRAFDLDGSEFRDACRECGRGRTIQLAREARAVRRAEIVMLKNERRSLIAALVRHDARIAELEADQEPPRTEIGVLKNDRQALIAALVRHDARIAELEADQADQEPVSSSFTHVDPAEVFDADADTDLGFGD